MRLLLDTNVVLDVMLDRRPFAADSSIVMASAETGGTEAYLCATTITTIHYLAAKTLGRKEAARQIANLLRIFRIAPVTAAILNAALQIETRDFEDAVLFEAAKGIQAEAIITRNPADFPKNDIPIHTPKDMVEMLGTD